VLIHLIKICLFYLIKLIPKKKTLVFGDRAGRRFADNSRYLFFYLLNNRKNFKCVWISKDKNIINYIRKKKLLAYHSSSLLGIYYCLTAKCHFYNFVEDDINKIISQLSNSINLWHGVLPKKIKGLSLNTPKLQLYLNKRIKKQFLYPNKDMASNIFDRFSKNKYELKISNLQRNIIFSDKEKNTDIYRTDNEIIFRKKLKALNKNIFGYFPTWREDGLELFKDVNNLKKLNSLNTLLKKTNSLILIKRHMNSDIRDKNILYNNEGEKMNNYLGSLDSFVFIDYDFDLNSILDICDLVISDYSGVMFDFLNLDRPIISYVPDYIEFEKKIGFMFDPIKHDFTYHAFTIDELNKLINEYSLNKKEFINKHTIQRKKVKDYIFLESSGMNSVISLIDEM